MLAKKKCIWVTEKAGHIIEIECSLKEIPLYLNGTSTIIGTIPELDAVILKCYESPLDLMVNHNTEILPIEDKNVLGSILIVRMDENSEHQDLTLSEVEPKLHHQV